MQYKIKWLGYPESQNSWTFAELCNCSELINEYEFSNWEAIIGAGQTDLGLKYAIKSKCFFAFDLVASRDVIARWPQELISYLEEQIIFKPPPQMPKSVQFLDEVVINPNNIFGRPSNILGAY